MRAPRLAARVRPRRSCATVPPSSFSPRSTAARPISRRTTRPGRAWIFGSRSGDRVTAPQRTLLALIGLHAQPLIAQRLQLRQGVFGFANAEGTELLALDSVANPTQIRGAVCAGARLYRVAYARRQSRQPAGNGRQVAANFRNEAGDVFRLVGSTPRGDETCYLSRFARRLWDSVSVSPPRHVRDSVDLGWYRRRGLLSPGRGLGQRLPQRCHELPILGSGVGHVRARCFKPTGDCGPPSRSRCSTQEAARE